MGSPDKKKEDADWERNQHLKYAIELDGNEVEALFGCIGIAVLSIDDDDDNPRAKLHATLHLHGHLAEQINHEPNKELHGKPHSEIILKVAQLGIMKAAKFGLVDGDKEHTGSDITAMMKEAGLEIDKEESASS